MSIEWDPDRGSATEGVGDDSRRPDPDSIVAMLDEQQRTVLRITPEHVLYQE